MVDSEALPKATRNIGALVLGLAVALAPISASAIFIVNLPWMLPAGKGKSTEVFMVLQSSDGGALVGARSDVASSVTIVAAGANGDTMDRLPLPRGEAVPLAPGKIRLLLSALDRTLKQGDRVAIVLTIEAVDGSRQDIPVNVEVRRHSALEDELRAHHHH